MAWWLSLAEEDGVDAVVDVVQELLCGSAMVTCLVATSLSILSWSRGGREGEGIAPVTDTHEVDAGDSHPSTLPALESDVRLGCISGVG